MINFEKQTWYNKNDIDNEAKRIPISASHLNRIEEAVSATVDHTNDMTNHCWERSRFVGGDAKLGGDNASKLFYLWSTSSQTSVIYHSNTVKVLIDEDTGEVYAELENPSAWEVSYDSHGSSNKTILKGKYFIFDNPSTLGGGKIYYSNGESARLGDGSETYKYGLRLYGLSHVSIRGFYEELDYVSSPNKDKYSDGWNGDEGLFFRYLGVPFENARDVMKVEIGSYKGTGARSIDLAFSKNPYFVFLQGSYVHPILKRGFGSCVVLYKDAQETITCDWSVENALFCSFASDLIPLFNAEGVNYSYIAIVA